MSGDREKQNKKTLQTSKNGLQRCFLASLGRFELPAFRLGGERSILLSYRDVYQNYSIIPLKRIRTSYRLGGDRSIQLSYGGEYETSKKYCTRFPTSCQWERAEVTCKSCRTTIDIGQRKKKDEG